MRAAVLREGRIVLRDDVPEPWPEAGQVLVRVRACGICGSDLHFAKHGARLLELGRQMKGMPATTAGEVDLGRDVYMGHELSAEVVDAGPDTSTFPPGTLVTSIPVLAGATGIQPVAYSNTVLGGYGEQMLLSAPLLVEVPNGLDPCHAALTEPMAVGLHAVNRSGIAAGEGAVVLGCGPIGIAVIAALHLRGAEPIVAADLSAGRRALAARMGATTVVDPAREGALDAYAGAAHGAPVVFEAVGVPGMIDEAMRDAAPQTRIVVVGVCMAPDRITPFFGIAKELAVQFVLGYDPVEFTTSLRHLAEGEIDVQPLVTGRVGLDGVGSAFEELADPGSHCKIVVLP